MVRTLLCGAVVLGLCLGSSLSAEVKKEDTKKPEKKPEVKKPAKEKKGATVGKVKKFDAATGALTLTVKAKKDSKEENVAKEITIPQGAKVIVYEGADSKKELTGKDGFKQIKKGANVTVLRDAEGNVVSVTLNKPTKAPKPKK